MGLVRSGTAGSRIFGPRSGLIVYDHDDHELCMSSRFFNSRDCMIIKNQGQWRCCLPRSFGHARISSNGLNNNSN